MRLRPAAPTLGFAFLLNLIAAFTSLLAATAIRPIATPLKYDDNRPTAQFRLDAKDAGVVLHYGDGPAECDTMGARDVWVWEHAGTYYMHYDGAGPKGWLACL